MEFFIFVPLAIGFDVDLFLMRILIRNLNIRFGQALEKLNVIKLIWRAFRQM